MKTRRRSSAGRAADFNPKVVGSIPTGGIANCLLGWSCGPLMIPRSNVVSPICPENGVRSAAFGPSRSSRSRPSTSVNKLLIELHGIFRQAQMVWRENWGRGR